MVYTQQQVRPEPSDAAWSQTGTAVDRWIKRELQRSYDQILSEPVPDDLLALLDCGPARH
jgi:hypothetical protein